MKGDFREAMRAAREQRAAEDDAAKADPTGVARDKRTEAHWDRLHRQLDMLPLMMVLVQIVAGVLLWILVIIALELRANAT